MGYTIGEDGLLDFSDCCTDEEKIRQSWDYFATNLQNVEIHAFDGKIVRGFTRTSFNHIVSGSSNKYDTALAHDIPFVEERAKRLPLIKKIITGAVKSKVYRELRANGRKSIVRRSLTIIEIEHRYFVVVLDEGPVNYRIRTAFPTNKNYFDRCIRGKGTNAGTWG